MAGINVGVMSGAAGARLRAYRPGDSRLRSRLGAVAHHRLVMGIVFAPTVS